MGLLRPSLRDKWALSCALALATLTVSAQTVPKTVGVTVALGTGVLAGPDESTKFFQYNLAAADLWLVKRTNGIAWNLSISGNSHVLSGGTLSFDSGSIFYLAPGSTAVAQSITIASNPFTAADTDTTTKYYVDTTRFVVVGNLTVLLQEPVTIDKIAYVRSNTGSDGAQGLWVWDPSSVWAVSERVKIPPFRNPNDPGRWFKVD